MKDKTMKSSIINNELIRLDLDFKSKDDIIKELCSILYAEQKISSIDGFIKDIQHRESIMSTFCGFDVAIPHAVSEFVKEPAFAFARTKTFSWSEDDEIVKYVFLLAIPAHQEANSDAKSHIDIMSSIAQLALDEKVREVWAAANTKEAILKSFNID